MSDVIAPAAEPTTSAPAAPATATPQAAAPQAATPPATSAPPTSGAPEGYVPSYRIRESREAAIREANAQAASRIAEVQAEAERYRAQLHSLVGATPRQNTEEDQIRDQFGKLYPGLSKMEANAARLEALLERAGDLESQNSHYWTSYGRQTMDRLFTHAAESLGTPLTDEGKRQLHASFTGFVQSSPELQERYANDPTIVEDFWKAFTSSFIDPVRRTASAGVVGRAGASAALPQDTPSGAPRSTPPPQASTLDERVALGWAQYKANQGQG